MLDDKLKQMGLGLRTVCAALTGRCQVFRARGSGWSSCRFTAATPPPFFVHPKTSDLRTSHGSSCWMLGGSGVRTSGPPPTAAPAGPYVGSECYDR